MNVYEEGKIHFWTREDSIYFRHIPYPGDFAVVITFALLNEINRAYDTEKSAELGIKAYKYLRDNHFKTAMLLVNIREILYGILLPVGNVAVIVMMAYRPECIISWLLFSLNVVTFALALIEDRSTDSLNRVVITAKITTYLTAVILILEFTFAVFIGGKSFEQQTTNASWFRSHYPRID